MYRYWGQKFQYLAIFYKMLATGLGYFCSKSGELTFNIFIRSTLSFIINIPCQQNIRATSNTGLAACRFLYLRPYFGCKRFFCHEVSDRAGDINKSFIDANGFKFVGIFKQNLKFYDMPTVRLAHCSA